MPPLDNEWVDIDPATRKDTQWSVGQTVTVIPAKPNVQLQVDPTGIVLQSPVAVVSAKASTASPATPATLTALERKQRPLCEGVLDYFPDALMEVAYCSWVGNNQHNPGQPLHWAREKSTDQADCVMRHLKDRGTIDTDGVRHSAKTAWRALALLQLEIERERGQ